MLFNSISRLNLGSILGKRVWENLHINKLPYSNSLIRNRTISLSTVFGNRFYGTKVRRNFYDMFPDVVSKPPPQGPFDIDAKALRRSYLKQAKFMHPDVAQGEDRKAIELKAAELSKAYRTLLSPLSRAEYILSLNNESADSEEIKNNDPEFLMQILEVHEQLQEVGSSPDALNRLKQENDERKQNEIANLKQAMEKADWEQARYFVARLRYWESISRNIQEL
ncbi:DNAJ domain-containing protein Jac1 [Schizosaccharomyces japonicus yFS275]|uniref:DNAJ domain-containing protein Jac1 n=1 Tax=Schizosaccharomyces japonicus (strain yFS275 / FY16936) TaxID=402676 RepID=B6JUW7_SCHJY|nr:DNAJ domain-containing protein Jac1 [Schizosaccharomyces japonicus yFS275]EEB05071.1 DNAJ domain-containing protein Jac1 [Schizosaccharomyces japonicus yFS275]